MGLQPDIQQVDSGATTLVGRQVDFDGSRLSPLPPGEGAKATEAENLKFILTLY